MAIATLAPPRLGWIRGQANGAPLDLNFNRTQHTVTGTANQDSVSLSVDHDRGRVEGEANGHEVDLQMQWSPKLVHFSGQANGKQLQMDVDHAQHTITGHSGPETWNLRFDQDSLHGTVGNRAVDLELDLSSGQLSGSVNGQSVEAEMINLDMGTLATNLYLLTK